jgi:hypothetical protein
MKALSASLYEGALRLITMTEETSGSGRVDLAMAPVPRLSFIHRAVEGAGQEHAELVSEPRIVLEDIGLGGSARILFRRSESELPGGPMIQTTFGEVEELELS